MKDRMSLETERHTLLCSIERCRQIVGLKRDVERLKSRLATIDHQLAAFYDYPGATVLRSAGEADHVPDGVLIVGLPAETGIGLDEK